MHRLLLILFLLIGAAAMGQADKSEGKKKEAAEPATESVAPSLDGLEEKELEDARSGKNKTQSLKERYKKNPGRAEAKDADASVQNQANTFEFSKRRATVQRTQRSPSMDQQTEMNQVVDYFEQNAPNSFEYNYFKYVAGNYDVGLIDNLNAAEELRPNNSDVHVQKAAYHIIIEDYSNAKKYLSKLIDEQRLNQNLFPYAEDILISTPHNGTLITHGFDDTYSIWYVQQVKGVRRDVTLVSLDFLQSSKYRSKLISDGYKMPNGEVIDVSYFAKFCQNNSKKNLVVSMTTPKEYVKPVMSNMYVTGVVFAYKTSEFDNFPMNENLWNSELNKSITKDAKDQKTRQLSSNYLPMLFQMRKVYNEQSEASKVKEIDKYIDNIGVQCKKYDKVQGLKQAY